MTKLFKPSFKSAVERQIDEEFEKNEKLFEANSVCKFFSFQIQIKI